jgi:hypothetical protein
VKEQQKCHWPESKNNNNTTFISAHHTSSHFPLQHVKSPGSLWSCPNPYCSSKVHKVFLSEANLNKHFGSKPACYKFARQYVHSAFVDQKCFLFPQILLLTIKQHTKMLLNRWYTWGRSRTECTRFSIDGIYRQLRWLWRPWFLPSWIGWHGLPWLHFHSWCMPVVVDIWRTKIPLSRTKLSRTKISMDALSKTNPKRHWQTKEEMIYKVIRADVMDPRNIVLTPWIFIVAGHFAALRKQIQYRWHVCSLKQADGMGQYNIPS